MADPALPPYPPDPALQDPGRWAVLPIEDGLGRLDDLSLHTRTASVVDALPDSVDAAREADYVLRAQVTGERLWLLGYIGGDRRRARELHREDRAAFLDAVSRFQRDARLRTDSWLGPKTWHALETLLCFEGGPPGAQWMDVPHWCPALLRAAQLRLATLGFDAPPPAADFAHPTTAAIRQFHSVARALRLVDDDRGDLLDVDTLALLLDQDSLVRAVADLAVERRGALAFRFFRPRSEDATAARASMRGFLVQLVKVELWLLGMELSITGQDDYAVAGFRGPRAKRRPERHVMGRALIEYHRRIEGLPRTAAEAASTLITPELFRTLAQGSSAPATAASSASEQLDEDAYRWVAGEVTSQADVDSALATGRSLGMRIFDGLRRLWRRFRRGLRRALQFGRNLARVFYRYVDKGVRILRTASQAFVEAVRTLWRGGVLEGSSIARIDGDLDLDVYLLDASDAIGPRLQRFARRLRFAARLLRIAFDAIVSASLARWARLARALVTELPKLVPLYNALRAAP